MKKEVIRIKLDNGAKMPEYAHEDDACMDIFSNESLVLLPRHRAAVKTGVYMELPRGYVSLVKDKSGLAIKNGISTLGGVIDSGYRGEYLIILVNLSSMPFKIEKGMKIAQVLIQKVERLDLETVEKLNDSDRGDGRFGSTGSGLKNKPIKHKSGLHDIKKAVN